MKQLFQFRNLSKRNLLPVIAFIISFEASAQSFFQKPEIHSRTIELTQAFDKIEVFGDAKIILTNTLEGRLIFKGDPANVRAAKARIKNGKLIISAGWQESLGNFTVYVPASNVRWLETSGKTEILSLGTIKTKDLEILLNGSSTVSINYDGKLKVTPGTGYEMIYSND